MANLNPAWSGGATVDPDGRVLLFVGRLYPGSNPKGYIQRARFVWQESHGEVLGREDLIHHINGEKDDDRLVNLQKVTRSEHACIHRRNAFRRKREVGGGDSQHAG